MLSSKEPLILVAKTLEERDSWVRIISSAIEGNI